MHRETNNKTRTAYTSRSRHLLFFKYLSLRERHLKNRINLILLVRMLKAVFNHHRLFVRGRKRHPMVLPTRRYDGPLCQSWSFCLVRASKSIPAQAVGLDLGSSSRIQSRNFACKYVTVPTSCPSLFAPHGAI